MVTNKTEPDLDAWQQQERRQRRRGIGRRTAAFAVAAAVLAAAIVAVAALRDTRRTSRRPPPRRRSWARPGSSPTTRSRNGVSHVCRQDVASFGPRLSQDGQHDRVPASGRVTPRSSSSAIDGTAGGAGDRTSRATGMRLRLVRPDVVADGTQLAFSGTERTGNRGHLRADIADRHRSAADPRDRHSFEMTPGMVAATAHSIVFAEGRWDADPAPAAARSDVDPPCGPTSGRPARDGRPVRPSRHGRPNGTEVRPRPRTSTGRDGAVRQRRVDGTRSARPPSADGTEDDGARVVARRHADRVRPWQRDRGPHGRRAARSGTSGTAATPPGARTAPRSTPGRPGYVRPRCREARSPGGAGLRP